MKRSLLVGAVVVLAALACNNVGKPPGVSVVDINFEAMPASRDATLSFQEVPDGNFYFPSLITRETATLPGGGYRAYFTFDGVARDGGFDGQYLISDATATRTFAACGCPNDVTVQENITIALLSKSQATAAGNNCPNNPLDGGVEALGGSRPALTDDGSDVTRACGYLTDLFIPDPDPAKNCNCTGGTAVFVLDGGL